MDDSPAPKLSELLRHPDDLDKIPALKMEFSRKKAAVDSQLGAGLRDQLETTQSGMTGLTDGQKTVQLIKEEMMKIDKLCSESQNMIKDFASINIVSQAHRNFGLVETMRRNLETFEDRLGRVEQMVREDTADDQNMSNLLFCHYELTQLRNIRDDAMEQIQRAEDPSLQSTLEDYFARLEDTIEGFDHNIGVLAMDLIHHVLSGNTGIVTRFAVIIDAEEKSDQRVLALQQALKDHQEMAVRFQSITDGARTVREYKERFILAIKQSAEDCLLKAKPKFLEEPDKLEKVLKEFFNDLNVVKIGMAPLMPKRWKIAKTYADIYHQAMHDFLIDMVDGDEVTSEHRLAIVGFPDKYYKKMGKLGLRPEDLSPHVLDNREAELVRDFQQLIVKFLDEWIDRIFAQEKRDFADRNVEGSNLDQDEYGYLRSKNLVALWRMLREQVEAAANSQRADVVEGVVDTMFSRLRTRQQSWQRLLDDEAAKFEADKVDTTELEGIQHLHDWLVATANDQIACIDDNEEDDGLGGGGGRLAYLSHFRQLFEPHVTPAHLEHADQEMASLRIHYIDMSTWCITKFTHLIFAVDFRDVMPDFFTPRWYTSTVMKQMVVTIEEYVNDYRQVLHHDLVDIFVENFSDELLARYLLCVRNRGARFRRADPFQDKLFNDISTAFEFFNSLPNKEVGEAIKQRWRVTEMFLALLTADRDTVADAYAEFKASYWDLQMSWVEAVLRSRDDFDRGMLTAVKTRAGQVDVPRGLETIMGKIK